MKILLALMGFFMPGGNPMTIVMGGFDRVGQSGAMLTFDGRVDFRATVTGSGSVSGNVVITGESGGTVASLSPSGTNSASSRTSSSVPAGKYKASCAAIGTGSSILVEAFLVSDVAGDPSPHQVPSATTGVNIEGNADVNFIDPATHSSVIVGGGIAESPNQIGLAFGGETGTYVAGDASYAFIHGGYDNINNQIAGTIGGGAHHRLHSSGDHGTAIGGSSNEIKSGSYNIIAGGGGVAQANMISGGGSNVAIVGGLSNLKTGAGNGSAMIGGNGNTDSSSGSYNAIVAGQSVTISGTAQNAAVFGTSHTITQSSGLTFGISQKPVSPASLTFGGKAITTAGDVQAISFAAGIVTTNATVGTLTITGSNLQFDNTKTSGFVGKFMILGIDTATKNMCAFQGEIVGYWDGTNLYFDDTAAAATGPATSGERSLIVISDAITVGGVTIALTAGQLRFKATGKAATNIQWVARADIVMTYF